jgi:hypothetical protein
MALTMRKDNVRTNHLPRWSLTRGPEYECVVWLVAALRGRARVVAGVTRRGRDQLARVSLVAMLVFG